ncbi:phospho-N-acetylmuramoyl-pentapeptide-transferase [Weissella uvarum]|uniref:phospho-N-acetylmuramoyl-pentapeptide- transferase n=1 Tax=Weissella uvarum TaxID=1479233 RepID=UPI0019604A84|nr:phospho-N-acetylmuramoyl-pentapeptide-transferase [Weissella uvarum]MBM7617793.1 phospho-N-acetylmuramoyl-pentapeptide-transferase [Weissella uvarum]MCM0595828.1 phospho-N-acetylmuramoyl-pentapeptide-transferase [Weissella uvarum]
MWNLVIGLLVGLATTLVVVPALRNWFKKIKVEQLVMRSGENEPDHAAKAGTPTMGGAGFIAVVVIGFLILSFVLKSFDVTAFVVILAILFYAIVGGFDDSIKVFNHRDEGFRFLPKLSVEILAAILGVILLHMSGFEFSLALPFGLPTLHNTFLYTIFVIIWLVGWSNATNLTDGLDGLATGLAIIAYGAYLIIAWQQANAGVILVDALMIGALIGFFVFNHYPASIFMGDTGSLALGAGLAMNSIVLHQEWSLLLIGVVFMLDTLSVIIQISWYRLTGKRIFLITPIHHSVEKGGLTGNVDHPWNEWQVDSLFWAIGLIGAGLYFLIF